MSLQIDTTIPYGNACDISIRVGESTPEVGFSADPHGGLETLWFCFRLVDKEAEITGPIRLVLKNPQNLLGYLPATNIRPVVRPKDGDWERLGAGTIETLPDGRIQVVWMLNLTSAYIDVAFCYPYGVPEVEQLTRDTDDYWQLDTVGVSQAARPILRLSNDYGEADSKRPGLYLIARQHSGETPGSWVLDGFLRHLASLGEHTPVVWAIPLSNIDGVEQGDYGKDNWPYDLNRAWHTGLRRPMRHEVLVIQRDIRLWAKRCRPMLAIDFHAPGGTEAEGIYFHLPDPETDIQHYQQSFKWVDAIKDAMSPKYARPFSPRFSKYPSRWDEPWGRPGFKTYMWDQYQTCGLSIETPYALINDLVLTRERYQEAGARIAQGIVKGLLKRYEAL